MRYKCGPAPAPKIYKNPQRWLSKNYAGKRKVERIDFRRLRFKQSSNELIINNYSNLKEVDGYSV